MHSGGAKTLTKKAGNDRKKSRTQCLPVIKCKCGQKILLVPDLTAMSEAIEEHVRGHVEKEPNLTDRKVVANQIRDDLISQVFKIAGN
jgi:hypothetical protein